MANLANGKLADLTKLLQSSKLNRVAGAYRLNRVQAYSPYVVTPYLLLYLKSSL